MENKSFNTKLINSTKWLALIEIMTKLTTPITNMVLARVIAPDEFGVVATITMIISFADMFTDSGFQKYLIQHEFKKEEEKYYYANVAFWCNFFLSIILWLIIGIVSDPLAKIVGNPGLGKVIIVACVQLPLTSFSSIQIALYRRSFNFKTLSLIRLITIFIPFIITIPLALLGYGYWALIIANIIVSLLNSVMLTLNSKWKPQFYFKYEVLRDMLSFSIWTLIESFSIWLTTWIDSFIVGTALNAYLLGLYKNSINLVNSIFSIVTSTATPILFSGLSRIQNNEKEFNHLFFITQKTVAYIIFPMSIGIYVYRDLVVKILLGNQWIEASWIIGLWSLVSGIVIVLGHFSSEVYRAKGRPKLSFMAQILHLIVLVPVCLSVASKGFFIFVTTRSLIRLQAIVVDLLIIEFIVGISVAKIINNIKTSFVCSLLMGYVGSILRGISVNIFWSFLSIIICIFVYIGLLLCFKNSREDIKCLINNFVIKKNIDSKIINGNI